MTDIVANSPRDLFVNLIGKAIGTGARTAGRRSTRDDTFYMGRSTAFVYSAAMLADQMYGCTFSDVRTRIQREVTDVMRTWSTNELRDAKYVGEQATLIAMRVLGEV